jgi:DNA-binding NarL/FixJ family response regulator
LLAETGQKGLRTIRDNLVDGVILDYATPFAKYDIAGHRSRTLEAITDASPFLPLVLTSESMGELSHAASLMADMILVEPVNPGALLDAVETVLQETLRERARRKAGSIAVLR